MKLIPNVTTRTKVGIAQNISTGLILFYLAIGFLVLVHHQWSLKTAWISDYWAFEFMFWTLPITGVMLRYYMKQNFFSVIGNPGAHETRIYFEEIIDVDPIYKAGQAVYTYGDCIYRISEIDYLHYLDRYNKGWKECP